MLEIPATLMLNNNRLTGSAKFKVKPEDYKIEIPALVKNKIASEVEVTVNINAENCQDEQKQSAGPEREPHPQSLKPFHGHFPLKGDSPRRVSYGST